MKKKLCERETRTQAELLGSEKGGLMRAARAAVDLEHSERGVGSRDGRREMGINSTGPLVSKGVRGHEI